MKITPVLAVHLASFCSLSHPSIFPHSSAHTSLLVRRDFPFSGRGMPLYYFLEHLNGKQKFALIDEKEHLSLKKRS